MKTNSRQMSSRPSIRRKSRRAKSSISISLVFENLVWNLFIFSFANAIQSSLISMTANKEYEESSCHYESDNPAETTSLPLPAAKSLPNNSLVAGSSHTPHNSSIVAPSIYEAKAPPTYSAPMAFLPPASAFPPSLPPASAFRHQPISPPGKANIVAILRRRELDSKK